MSASDKNIEAFILTAIALVILVTLGGAFFACYMTYSEARNNRICLDNGYTEYKNGYCVRDINKETVKVEDIAGGQTNGR